MQDHWWKRAAAFVGLLAVVGLVAWFAYGAGTMHAVDGAAMAAMAERHAGEVGPGFGYGPGYGYGHGGWGHGPFGAGFGFLRVLFAILFFGLLFRLLGFVIFGGRHRGGPWGYGWQGGPSGPGGPGGPRWDRRREMFEDWHRSAHADETGASTPTPVTTSAPEPPASDEPRA